MRPAAGRLLEWKAGADREGLFRIAPVRRQPETLLELRDRACVANEITAGGDPLCIIGGRQQVVALRREFAHGALLLLALGPVVASGSVRVTPEVTAVHEQASVTPNEERRSDEETVLAAAETAWRAGFRRRVATMKAAMSLATNEDLPTPQTDGDD